MDYNTIDDFLNSQITRRPDLNGGFKEIKVLLETSNIPVLEIDINQLKFEFDEWLEEVLTKEPTSKNVKSLYFGISNLSFPDIDDGEYKTTVSISGSRFSAEAEDWACDETYLPARRYVILEEFGKIDSLIKSDNTLFDSTFEVLVFNGVLNLLLMNFADEHTSLLLKYSYKKFGVFPAEKERLRIDIGAGFDSGEAYMIGAYQKSI